MGYPLESIALESLIRQTLTLLQQKEEEKKQQRKDECLLMPRGGVLICPFVDYTEPSGSMVEYQKHDLIVNQSVTETGFPYFQMLGRHRKSTSPLYRKFGFGSSSSANGTSGCDLC